MISLEKNSEISATMFIAIVLAAFRKRRVLAAPAYISNSYRCEERFSSDSNVRIGISIDPFNY
jgi:hypothetical protein